jgi:hypothetical protein
MSYARQGRNLGAAADAEIAELEETNIDLGYQLAAADSTIMQQEQALLEKNAEIENLNGVVVEWQDYATGLEKALADCQGTVTPTPTEPVSLFGSSTGKHTYATFAARAGAPLSVRRTYDTWPARHPAEDAGRNASVWSFKPPFVQFLAGALDADFMAALNSIPDDGYQRYVIVYHEPEDNIENGEFTASQYREAQVRARAIIDGANTKRQTRIRFGGNLMSWSFQTASNRNPENYFPGAGVWDFLALDGYSGRNEKTNTWTGGRSPDEIFGSALEFCTQKGVRFAIAETGIDVLAPEPDRVAWIKSCRNYAKGANCEFWCYWDGSFSTFWLNTDAEFKAVVLGS